MRLLTQLLVPILVVGAASVSAEARNLHPQPLPPPVGTIIRLQEEGAQLKHLPWSREKETRHREVVI